MDVTGKADQSRQDGGLAEMCSTSNLTPQFGEQFPYGFINFAQPKEMKLPETSTNMQGFLDYSMNCNLTPQFEMHRPMYNDNMCHAWNPEPGQCSLPMMDANSYSQHQVRRL